MNLAAGEVLARAKERGYSPREIEPCIVSKLPGGRWLVDVESPHYPHPRAQTASRPPLPPRPRPPGPGLCLKVILSWFKITSSAGCSCNKRAMSMDEMGCLRCLLRIREISGWLGEEAARRKMAYRPWKGYCLVLSAVCMSLAMRAIQSIRR